MNLTPKQTVAYLDEYIIGQFNAKKAIAIALRNRYRRLKLEGDMAEEVMPKNILMIGSTGVGKTEIARRMAKMLSLPFVKVEASKYTEVGFVGRDVESMVRDLMMASINLVKAEHKEKNKDDIALHVEKTIIEKEINFSKTELPTKLEEYELVKIDVIDEIYSTYQRELEIFKELYSSVLEFVLKEKEKLGSTSFVDFTTRITIDKNILTNSLVAFFDGRRQQFKEEDLKELVAKYSDETSLDNVNTMFTELINLITNDKRPLKQQFKDGKQLVDFYIELFGLKYLKVEYDILFDNKNVKQLSPGERGALLIIFYLLIDKGDIPLIIDQPEDNLDNESVFEYLVPYIKQAKQRRQIIIVTHNPNIAVVADAEQVIYTELDKANGNQIKYITGAIEDKEINKQIVKVLEGTMPAFDNRTVKYYRN